MGKDKPLSISSICKNQSSKTTTVNVFQNTMPPFWTQNHKSDMSCSMWHEIFLTNSLIFTVTWNLEDTTLPCQNAVTITHVDPCYNLLPQQPNSFISQSAAPFFPDLWSIQCLSGYRTALSDNYSWRPDSPQPPGKSHNAGSCQTPRQKKINMSFLQCLVGLRNNLTRDRSQKKGSKKVLK